MLSFIIFALGVVGGIALGSVVLLSPTVNAINIIAYVLGCVIGVGSIILR